MEFENKIRDLCKRSRWYPLIGARVYRAYVTHDSMTLVVDHPSLGRIHARARAVGECCATAWIEHVSGLDSLVGEVVLDIPEVAEERLGEAESLNAPPGSDFRGPEYFEAEDRYVYTITTTRGRCDVELRCSHNGFYGGWLEVECRQAPYPVQNGAKTDDF